MAISFVRRVPSVRWNSWTKWTTKSRSTSSSSVASAPWPIIKGDLFRAVENRHHSFHPL